MAGFTSSKVVSSRICGNARSFGKRKRYRVSFRKAPTVRSTSTCRPKLSEAYNNPDSRFRYAVRDEAGRIVASSGRRVGPLPTFFDLQDRHIYRYPPEGTGSDTLGAAVRSIIGKKVLFTQVEQTVPMTQSLNAAVFNEFFMDGGWLGIPFLAALLVISAFTVRTSLSPLKKLAALSARIDPGNSALRLPTTGIPDRGFSRW